MKHLAFLKSSLEIDFDRLLRREHSLVGLRREDLQPRHHLASDVVLRQHSPDRGQLRPTRQNFALIRASGEKEILTRRPYARGDVDFIEDFSLDQAESRSTKWQSRVIPIPVAHINTDYRKCQLDFRNSGTGFLVIASTSRLPCIRQAASWRSSSSRSGLRA